MNSPTLTKREKEMLGFIRQGITSSKEIAQKTGLFYRTVETHVHNAMKKTSINQRIKIFSLCKD